MNNQQIDIQVAEQDGQTLITSYADMAGTLAGDGVHTVPVAILPGGFWSDFWPGKYAYDAQAQAVTVSGVARPEEVAEGQTPMERLAAEVEMLTECIIEMAGIIYE